MTDPEEAVAAPLRELYELLTDKFDTEIDPKVRLAAIINQARTTEDRPPAT